MVKRKLLLRLTAAAFIPAIVLCQFLPTVVSDPIQEAHSWAQMADDISMITQAIRTYNQIAYAAGWTPVKSPWLGIATPIMTSITPSYDGATGATGAWNEAVNLGTNIPGAYGAATYGMTPPSLYNRLRLGQGAVTAAIASVNIADGANPATLATVANSRRIQLYNNQAISALEQDAQDPTYRTNTEVEQLNQVSNGNVLINRQLQDTNALLTAAAEELALHGKISRDELVDAINFEADIDSAVMSQPAIPSTAAQTLVNW